MGCEARELKQGVGSKEGRSMQQEMERGAAAQQEGKAGGFADRGIEAKRV